MRSPATFAAAVLLAGVSMLHAEESPLFLSLTRRARPIDDTPSNVSVVTSKEIEQKNARTLGEALAGLPGVAQGTYGTYGGNNNLMLRGSSAEQVLVMIDGRRINDPAQGLVDAGSIPADNIDHIEIIRGGASAVYGSSAFGGAVNIITKRQYDQTPSVDLAASYGDHNTRRLSLAAGARQGPLSGSITGSSLLSDGWRQNSDYDGRDVFVRLGYETKDYGIFDLSGSVFRSETGVPGFGATLGQYNGTIERQSSSPRARQDQSNQYARLEHQMQWHKDTLKTVVYTSRNRTDYRDPDYFSDDRYISMTYGTEVQYAAENGTTAGGEWWQDGFLQTNNIIGADTVDRSRDSSAVYLLHELRLGGFSAIPGIRLDSNSSFGSIFSPKITLLYDINGQWKVSANTGRSWRSPTFNELYSPAYSYTDLDGALNTTRGNANLQPEDGIASDIGARFSGKDVQGAVSAFLTRGKNLISWHQSLAPNAAPGSPAYIFQPVNISGSRQAGIEMELSQRIISGLYHRANYTYLWAEDTERNVVLPYRPMHTINYELTCLFSWNMKASGTVRYYSETKTGTVSTADSLPGYTLTGIRIAQKFAGTELWVSIDNIADIRYQTRIGYPLPGRAFSAGLSMKL